MTDHKALLSVTNVVSPVSEERVDTGRGMPKQTTTIADVVRGLAPRLRGPFSDAEKAVMARMDAESVYGYDDLADHERGNVVGRPLGK